MDKATDSNYNVHNLVVYIKVKLHLVIVNIKSAVTSLVSETVSYTRHCTGNATLTSAVMLSSSSSRHNYSDQSDLTSTAMLTSSRRNRSNRADLTSAAS
ncbi:hypothetical protein TSUD_301390 [Trifolium subterraneum]|uniref:Uncharacterized protein n=1 Tax=Trifolium subterraneum TaxID=3900 RepID=A0A2Z6NF21_TRISU|nr:hypothetical protein TSUD_301390 [Trifolium subterraneum]